MFEGFETRRLRPLADGAELHLRLGGAGPPVLLIHGYPQSHICWHRIAPVLAERYSVVAPDLRGYGDSAPVPGAAEDDPTPYAKRAMAAELVALMDALGHGRFAVVGHDRGARVAYRLALDQPDRVAALATLDIVPTLDTWERMDAESGLATYHWMFLAQPGRLPETLIAADPDFFLDWTLRAWAGDGFAFDAEALAAYRRCFRRSEVIHATCQDYRAGATLDRAHDAADRAAGRRIDSPMLALWGRGTHDRKAFDFPGIWRRWADRLETGEVACGHFLPEEAPDAVLAALRPFLDAHL